MSDPTLCESASLEMSFVGDPDAPDFIPPCDLPATTEFNGHALCPGCADALLQFIALGCRLRRIVARDAAAGGGA